MQPYRYYCQQQQASTSAVYSWYIDRLSIGVAANWSVAARQSVSLWPAGGHWRATG